MVDKVVLLATVTDGNGGFVAAINDLGIEADGESLEGAQDNLIKSFRNWLEGCEGREDLAQLLADAGYPGVEENTELELQFVE